MSVYFGTTNMISDGKVPSILALGDSWFWYPFEANLLSQLSPALKPDYATILAVGQNGATLESYVSGIHARTFALLLTPNWLPYYSAILLSGGGNDSVNWDFCLRTDCSNIQDPHECLEILHLHRHLSEIQAWMLALINEIEHVYAQARLRRPDIFLHSYDYAPPNGKPASLPLVGVPLVGPWIEPAMERAGVGGYPLRCAVVHEYMDQFQATLGELESSADRVHLVRSLGTLDEEVDWANELHPNGIGFRKLARGPWLAKMQEAGFAP
jgi:hypothetical protein